MERQIDMKEVSDGRLYTINDMVKAGCEDCAGCSACCRGMGSSILLDPYDVYRMTIGLGKSFQELMAGAAELHVVDGIILPNLAMAGEGEACTFLNEEGRCSIHPYRPGICRLFPLGRIYEDNSFRYFLQIHECRKENRSKVKVKKWIDTPDVRRYEAFVSRWHYFLKDLQEEIKKSQSAERERQINLLVLQVFYLPPYAAGCDFYEQFEDRMEQAYGMLGWR